MNPISNIWNHPKTSAAGLLIAVVTIAGVLSQQGITWARPARGTVVTLVSAPGHRAAGPAGPRPALTRSSICRTQPPSWAPGR